MLSLCVPHCKRCLRLADKPHNSMQTNIRFCLPQPVFPEKAWGGQHKESILWLCTITHIGKSLICSFIYSDLSCKPLCLCGYIGGLERGGQLVVTDPILARPEVVQAVGPVLGQN